ncbi:lysophospholipid acyltransferase family protein [bacterium]|nr:lysophospholipid acyltransferase family protein [candidate division CSSED10-310 bacterium]
MSRKRKRNAKLYLLYILIAAIQTLARILTWRTAGRIGEWVGGISFMILPRFRRMTLDNITVGYPENLSRDRQTKLALDSFKNMGRCFMETIKLSGMSEKAIREKVDVREFESTVAGSFRNGRSIMLITGHYSNWELLAARLTLIQPVHVLYKRSSNPGFQSLIDANRSTLGITQIDRDDPSLVRKLREVSRKERQILGVLMDQDTRVRGVFSRFLKLPAYTPIGPAAIAIKGWFDVYVGFIHRTEAGRYAVKIQGPLEIRKTGRAKEDIQCNTDRFNELIGAQIMEDPAQWAWIHRRWRRWHEIGARQ